MTVSPHTASLPPGKEESDCCPVFRDGYDGGGMLDLIRDAWDRVIRFLAGRKAMGHGQVPGPAQGTPSAVPATASPAPGSAPGRQDPQAGRGESPTCGIAGENLSPVPESSSEVRESGATNAEPSPGENVPVLTRWEVSESPASPFEKCGRLFFRGDDLVVRSDRDPRGFSIPRADVARVLDGEAVPIRLDTGEPAGVAKRSASGKTVNFQIGPFLYTAPLAKVRDVAEGRARKAAVFMGRDSPGTKEGAS